MPTDVLIAGGGPAAVEAALVLHRLGADRVTTALLAPDADFTYRPLSVLGPFAAGRATTYPIARIAQDAGFTHRAGRLARVDAAGHTVETTAGERVPYDVLLVATGALTQPPFVHGLSFTGTPEDDERLHGLIQDVEAGSVKRIAFVVAAGNTWPLPLYELALMLAERAFQTGAAVELQLVTPEPEPLSIFGPDAAREVGTLLSGAGIQVHAGIAAEVTGKRAVRLAPGEDVLEVERIVTLPLLTGPRIEGLPADPAGFLVTDRHGRVHGAPDVYAAGDATAFPIKQGGLACQQADAAAEAIAARAGAAVEPAPFRPVLRGRLLTERWSRFLRRDVSGSAGDETDVAGRALWWPPTKIAGRELAGYLEALDEEAGRSISQARTVSVALDDDRPIELLSQLGAG